VKRSNAVVVALAFIAFVSLGLPDGLLGVAWPGIRRDFGLPLDALGVFLVASTTGYMLSSFLSGALIRTMGVGGLLAASCAATGTALAMFTFAPVWPVFVAFGSLAGLGAGAIDAGLNNYIDRNHGRKLMQWLHASFGVGITLGPLIMTAGLGLTGAWEPGYRLVAGAQVSLALAFLLTRRRWHPAPEDRVRPEDRARPEDRGPEENHGTQESRRVSIAADTEATLVGSIRNPASLLSMLLFFVYTGAELGFGLWIYTLLTEGRGVAPAAAGLVASGYWASFTLGRVIAGFGGERFSPLRLIAGSLLLALGGVVVVALDFGPVITVVGVAVTGIAVAPVFPALLSDTRNRVSENHISNTIGMQIAAAGLGAAALPSLVGVAARVLGLEAIPVSIVGVLALLLLLFLLSHRR